MLTTKPCIQPSKQPASSPQYMQHSVKPTHIAMPLNANSQWNEPDQPRRARERERRRKIRVKRCTESVSSRCSPALPACQTEKKRKIKTTRWVRVLHGLPEIDCITSGKSRLVIHLAVVSWWLRGIEERGWVYRMERCAKEIPHLEKMGIC